MAVMVEKEKSPRERGLSQGVEFCFHLKCKGCGRCPRQAGEGTWVVADGAPTQTLTGEKRPHHFSRDTGDNTARAFQPANDCFWTIFSGGSRYHRVQEPCQPRGAPTDTCAHRPAAFCGHSQAQPPPLLASDQSFWPPGLWGHTPGVWAPSGMTVRADSNTLSFNYHSRSSLCHHNDALPILRAPAVLPSAGTAVGSHCRSPCREPEGSLCKFPPRGQKKSTHSREIRADGKMESGLGGSFLSREKRNSTSKNR